MGVNDCISDMDKNHFKESQAIRPITRLMKMDSHHINNTPS
jgi:hypothetical protein